MSNDVAFNPKRLPRDAANFVPKLGGAWGSAPRSPSTSAFASGVTGLRVKAPGRKDVLIVLDEDVLLASEGREHAAGGLGINVAGESRLACSDGRSLLGAVSAPFLRELVGVDNGIQLTREAQSDEYPKRLLKWFRKHLDLRVSLAGAPARGLGSPLQSRRSENLRLSLDFSRGLE